MWQKQFLPAKLIFAIPVFSTHDKNFFFPPSGKTCQPCCWCGIRKSIQPVNNWVDEVLVWLSVWSELQVICIWSSWCHCHPITSCFIKIQICLAFLVAAYQGCPEKEDVKRCLMHSAERQNIHHITWPFFTVFTCFEQVKITIKNYMLVIKRQI